MSYWTEHDPPMSFIPEGWTYGQKRKFRYDCIPYLRPWLEAREHLFKGKRVLCVGDGAGIDAVEIARMGAHVSVIDMSEKAVALSLKHAEEAGVYERFLAWDCDATNIVSGSAQRIWIDLKEFYDVVYSFGVIHHIPDVHGTVSEIHRVLRPGGWFLGMVYNRDSLLYAYSILKRGLEAGLSPDEAMRKWSERNEGCPHSVAYTSDELLHLLQRCGFSAAKTEPQYSVIDLPEKRKVPVAVDLIGDRLGWHLMFEAKK